MFRMHARLYFLQNACYHMLGIECLMHSETTREYVLTYELAVCRGGER